MVVVQDNNTIEGGHCEDQLAENVQTDLLDTESLGDRMALDKQHILLGRRHHIHEQKTDRRSQLQTLTAV